MAFTFKDIIGQDDVKEHLLQMAEENRLPHALMFCGPQGAGKLPLALAFARSLLCRSSKDGEPCGICDDCRMLATWAHPDLHFSFPVYKAKSTDHPVSDDYLPQWREQLVKDPYFDMEQWLETIKADKQQLTVYVQESDLLQKKLALKSSQGGRKIVILWLPEKLSQEVANKLLKLIEEPPAKTHFLLVSEDPDMVLGTIQSRVQRINVPALSEGVIAEALMRLHGVPEALARETAHLAQGSYTEAEKRMAEGCESHEMQELFMRLMRESYTRKIKGMYSWTEEVAAMGRERQKRLLEYFQRQMRENFIYNFRRPEMTFLSKEESQFSTRFAPFINERNILFLTDLLSEAQRDIAQNVNPKMVFFDVALKMTILLKQ